MTFDFHPDAETEFLEAIAYYESCPRGLGEDFSLEVNSTVQNILTYSHAWPIVENDVRRRLTSRFPYGQSPPYPRHSSRITGFFRFARGDADGSK